MSVLMSATGLIRNIENLGNFGRGPGAGFSGGGENLAASVTSGLADLAGIGASAGGSMFAGQLELRARGLAGTGAPNKITSQGQLILRTLDAVTFLELLTGIGTPCAGDDLKSGAAQFSTVSRQLQSATPDDSWQGSASQAYAELVAALQDLAQTITDLDLKLAEVARDQAEWVTHMRLGLGILKDTLIAAYAIYWQIMLTLPPPQNMATASTFEITVCTLAIGTALAMLSTLLGESNKNGKMAHALGARYKEVAAAAAAETVTATSVEVPAAAQKSTVASFEDVSNSMSGITAVSETPTAASAGPLPTEGATADDLATVSGGTEETAASRSFELPQAPDLPAFTPPTRQQMTAAAAHAVQISGHVSQQVNQTMGSVQQLAAMGQQSQGAGPAKETVEQPDAEKAPPADSAAAAGGTAGTGPAPVEATAPDGLSTNTVAQPRQSG